MKESSSAESPPADYTFTRGFVCAVASGDLARPKGLTVAGQRRFVPDFADANGTAHRGAVIRHASGLRTRANSTSAVGWTDTEHGSQEKHLTVAVDFQYNGVPGGVVANDSGEVGEVSNSIAIDGHDDVTEL